MKYADSRGFALALIAGQDELATQTCQLKDLRRGESQTISGEDGIERLVAMIREILDRSEKNAVLPRN